jgi:hypothetical protein
MPDVKIGWRSGTVPSLLDTYTGAAAAYSLRKLRNAHSGFAIRVRRSSDNTEQNIGFTATGGLDTTALLSFVGAGNGFVTTWYDQGAGGYNLTQSIASNQPSIVLSGVLNTQNNKPILITDYNSYLINSSLSINGTTNSIFATIKMVSTRGNIAMMAGYGNDNQHFVSRNINGNGRYYDSGGQEITAAVLPNGLNLIGIHENSSGVTVYENGKNVVSNFTHSVYNTNGIVIFRRHVSDGNYMPSGSGFSELIIYPNSSKLSSDSAISTDINSYYSVWDNDAEAFITATGISTISTGYANSIRTLVATLKSANIWSKLKAVYPFVGGTANTHKFNLKDPRDLDAAYRLNFYGGWNHYTSGPYGNGFNTYADTNLNPSVALSPNSSSIGIWTPNGLANHGFGVWSNSGANRFAITEYGGGFVDSQMTSPTTRAWGITYTTSGFIMGSRTSATSNKIYRFGSQIAVHPSYGGVPHNTTTNTADYPNANFWLGRVNGNTSINYYNNSLYFAYIADGLTDAEILALSNAAYTFRQSIGHY